jgi:hypothetical protein
MSRKDKENKLREVDNLLQHGFYTKEEIKNHLLRINIEYEVSGRTIENYIREIRDGICWSDELLNRYIPNKNIIIERNRGGLSATKDRKEQRHGYEKEFMYNKDKYPGFKLYTNRIGSEITTKLITFLERVKSIQGFDENFEDSSLIDDIEEIIEKEGYTISEDIKTTVRINSNRLFRGVEFNSSAEENIPICRDAIANEYVIKIKYKPFGKDETTLVVHPYLITEWNNRWFYIGRVEIETTNNESNFHQRINKINTFSFDRTTEKIEILRNKEYIESDIDLLKLLNLSVGTSVNWDNPIQEDVILKLYGDMPHYFDSKPLRHPYTKDGNKFTYPDMIITRELEQTILSYGENIEVLEPKHLRDKIMKRISKMQNRIVTI